MLRSSGPRSLRRPGNPDTRSVLSLSRETPEARGGRPAGPAATAPGVPGVSPLQGHCMHEEDHGLSWKHIAWQTGKTEVRRSRWLVISMKATVGDYEYGYFSYLYHDGTIG